MASGLGAEFAAARERLAQAFGRRAETAVETEIIYMTPVEESVPEPVTSGSGAGSGISEVDTTLTLTPDMVVTPVEDLTQTVATPDEEEKPDKKRWAALASSPAVVLFLVIQAFVIICIWCCWNANPETKKKSRGCMSLSLPKCCCRPRRPSNWLEDNIETWAVDPEAQQRTTMKEFQEAKEYRVRGTLGGPAEDVKKITDGKSTTNPHVHVVQQDTGIVL